MSSAKKLKTQCSGSGVPVELKRFAIKLAVNLRSRKVKLETILECLDGSEIEIVFEFLVIPRLANLQHQFDPQFGV